MDDRDKVNRRDFITTTAGAAGVAGTVAGATLTQAFAQSVTKELPPGFNDQEPLRRYWGKPLSEVVEVDLKTVAPELGDEAVRERHLIFCYLLMKVVYRFWNGNKRGPLGSYPLRTKQAEPSAPSAPTQRYRGDMISNPDGFRVNWDRYVGHNIACIAVDGNGEIIDFDFNHNDFFRSSAEHAESRMVRRLFSLTDIFDSWRTGQRAGGKPRAASLNEVTLYTSLESCAQCSGVMSLAGVKQIIYLQNDFTAYKIGNIMFNLANHIAGAPGAPIPIPGADVGLKHFKYSTTQILTSRIILRRQKRRTILPAHSIFRRTSLLLTSTRASRPFCARMPRAICLRMEPSCSTPCSSNFPTTGFPTRRHQARARFSPMPNA